ncbi:UNVERIFIED_CONTAM: hypothetical protein Slati_3543400 [Sesamum latifolium]|uniref:Uncharacterized protein n=1 Tax=Sesamum latifolium TaxID=2727402 RepID=A0AAW2UIA9_9LAMI
MFPTTLILLLFATLASSAITLPTSKRSLELKYQEMHKVATGEEGMVRRGQGFKIDKRMIGGMKKYWVMAETSNPQFVMALTLRAYQSAYGNYTTWILIVQTIGVVVGTITPLCRWFTAIRFKCLMTCHKISIREELKIEAHWTQSLVNWRDSFSNLQIRNNKCRKYIHDAKWFSLTFFIGVQIMMVLVSKLLLLIPALLVTPCLLWFNKFKAQCFSKLTTSNNEMCSESGGDTELNLSRFVLLLDGESELPKRTLKYIVRQADKVIEMGEKQQARNLILLLNIFSNFRGVREFDSYQVPSLHSQEPPNC